MLLLDTRLPFGSLIPGCEERLDPAGTGSFYNEGEADIVVDHIRALLATGNLQPIFKTVKSNFASVYTQLLFSS